jgi:hypothetical protein
VVVAQLGVRAMAQPNPPARPNSGPNVIVAVAGREGIGAIEPATPAYGRRHQFSVHTENMPSSPDRRPSHLKPVDERCSSYPLA